MVLFGFFMIMLCLLFDLLLQVSIGTVIIKLYLCQLYIYFLLFRQSLRHVLFVLIFYILLIDPFTEVSFIPLFLSLLMVILFIHRLREQIYTESYLVQSLWIFIIHSIQQILLVILVLKDWELWATTALLLNIVLNSFVLTLVTIPFFMTWDRWYDGFRKFIFGKKDVDPTDSLRSKRYNQL